MIYFKPTQGDQWRALVSRWSRDERAACRSLLLWGVPADWGVWIQGGVDTHVWYCPQAVRNHAKAVQLQQTARLISRKLPLRS